MEGWLKLHRTILDSRQFANPLELKIWVWLLCKASINDRFVSLKIGKGSQTIFLKRGQLVFGRNAAERELQIDASTVYIIIKRFKADGCIFIESNNQYSIISVAHYNDYQSSIEEEEIIIEEIVTSNQQPINNQLASSQQPTNNTVTSNQQHGNSTVTQYKKVKKEKKVNTVLEGLEINNEEKKPAVKNGFSNYQCFVDSYFEYYKSKNGGPPKFTSRDGDGLKQIAEFLRNQAKSRNPDKSPEEIEKMSLDGYKWIFSKWSLLPPYYQQKISPGKMAAEINEIFNYLNNNTKNGNSKTSKIDVGNIESMFTEIDRKYSKAAGF